MNFFEQLSACFELSNVRIAFVVCILISLCCAVVGVTLVLKRYSMVGDGLSHVAFGAMTIAMALTIADMYLMLPITIVVAIFLIRLTDKGKVKNDSAIAMLSVGALAIGYLIVNLAGNSANVSGDVCSSLFGSSSILTLDRLDLWLCVGLTIIVIVFSIIFHNKIFGITFDENFSKATGVRTNLYNNLIAILIGVIIVLAMKLVGSLLISALIVFPVLSAIRLFKSYKKVIIFSGIFGVMSSIIGLLLSMIINNAPIGATIVAVNIFVYFICWLIDIIVTNSKKA